MRNQRVFLVVLAFLVLGSAAAPASAQSPPTVLYRLLEGSTYTEGCFEPCMCPILAPVPLEGIFGLELLPTNGPLPVWAVTGVDWNVPALDKAITGSGFYTRGGDMQRIDLELMVNAEPLGSFTSGTTDGGNAFPLIELTVNMNDFFCYDVVMHLRAAPSAAIAPHLSVAHSTLSWTPVDGAAAYDVVCGDLVHLRAGGDLTTSTDQCLGSSYEGTSMDYALEVASGAALWFLVRDEADGGTYDSGSPGQAAARDPLIDAASVACP